MVDPSPSKANDSGVHKGLVKRLLRRVVGPPRDITPSVTREITLVAFLAWVGLGADGLSSSAYGPDEAFRSLLEDGHPYLAPLLALVTAITVFVLAAAQSHLIEEFPQGGGGYIVSTALLGRGTGLVAGCALLVDYVLTISVSVAAGSHLFFFFAPTGAKFLALPFGIAVVVVLTLLNLRGVKESVTVLLPIFLTFVVTHAILIVAGLLEHVRDVSETVKSIGEGFSRGHAELGLTGLLLVAARAYSMGAGTYTGIEAIANGVPIMREPKVRTAKRTLLYMALSLAITASGITLLYLLVNVRPDPAHAATPLNAILADLVARDFGWLGKPFVFLTVASEVALLVIAAQSGFLAGPRVMASMATDGWLPRRFAALSDRLAMQNGILLMGVAAALLLLYAEGSIVVLVTMYAINVFISLSLSNLGMIRLWYRKRSTEARWRRYTVVQALAFAICATMVVVTSVLKFGKGAWLTVVVTASLVALCVAIRRHYRFVLSKLAELDRLFCNMPPEPLAPPPPPLDPKAPTAALLVGGYRGIGIHSFLTIRRLFPGFYKNFVFMSVAVVDTEALRGPEHLATLKARTEAELQKFVKLAESGSIPATYRMAVGSDVVEEGKALCLSIAREFPRAHFFAGKLAFERDAWYDRILHNESAYAIQRQLQFEGLTTIVLPVRVLEKPRA